MSDDAMAKDLIIIALSACVLMFAYYATEPKAECKTKSDFISARSCLPPDCR